MIQKKNILVIIGSASRDSSNHKLVTVFMALTADEFNITLSDDLKTFPHFDPELSAHNTPPLVVAFRNAVEKADGVLICTPEYIFSIPSALKNVLEWCVSTTVFSGKPVGLITASASGQKGHEELQLIMKTIMARFTGDTTLLIQGIKGKVNQHGEITDTSISNALNKFIAAFKDLVNNEAQLARGAISTKP